MVVMAMESMNNMHNTCITCFFSTLRHPTNKGYTSVVDVTLHIRRLVTKSLLIGAKWKERGNRYKTCNSLRRYGTAHGHSDCT